MGKKKQRHSNFVMVDRGMLKSKEWRQDLSASEKILYIHLKAKYVGHNNGQICLHYSELKDLLSSATIAKSFKGLEVKGWVEKTKLGGLYRYQNNYRLTGKHDRAL